MVATLIFVAACGEPGTTGIGAGPTHTSTPTSARADPTPTATVFPGTPQPRATSTPVPFPVQTFALGPLTGDWYFVAKETPDPFRGTARIEILAIPAGGGSADVALAYEAPFRPSPDPLTEVHPYLRRQFSPDGQQIVISVAGRVAVVELSSGRVREIAVDRPSYSPSWSRDGTAIAVTQRTLASSDPLSAAHIVIPISDPPPSWLRVGRRPPFIVGIGLMAGSAEWSPSEPMVITKDHNGTYVLSSAAELRPAYLPYRTRPLIEAHWRAARPQIALVNSGCLLGTWRIFVKDDRDAQERVVVDTGERCSGDTLSDPRWSPSGNEIVYVRTHAGKPAAHIVDAMTGRDMRLPISPHEATWSWDGRAIAYLARSATGPFGETVRVWDRALGVERTLLSAGTSARLLSIASVRL